MRSDITAIIQNLDIRVKATDGLTDDLNFVLDRGNRPSISLINQLGQNNSDIQRELLELEALIDGLAIGVDSISDEDLAALKDAQKGFTAAQERHGQVILRTKKALGLIR
jgi:hypothetical protein